MDLKTIEHALAEYGLILLATFHVNPDDNIPGLAGADGTLVLAGNGGPAMWHCFASQRPEPSVSDPLDTWSRRVFEKVAAQLAGNVSALFPFHGPPYLPFQAWASKAGNAHPSPFGPMVHDTYGLWHAYRGALLIPSLLDLPVRQPQPSPCDACRHKPCLSACPVDAFGPGTYDIPACVGHLASGHGESCFGKGCLARSACPVGREFAYEEAQARFHLDTFFANHR